jgi:hypothetical protein
MIVIENLSHGYGKWWGRLLDLQELSDDMLLAIFTGAGDLKDWTLRIGGYDT